MASGSPRSRIDQFFASKKKKKFQSPRLKPVRDETRQKIAKLESSPSAKGSLQNYLVAAEDNNRTAKQLHGVQVSSFMQDPVKRNLAHDYNLLPCEQNKNALLSASGQPQIFYTDQEEADRKQSQDPVEVEGLSVRPSNSNSQSIASAGNPELKQFATDFLSLYCSDLPLSISTIAEPKAHLYKRQGSPSLLVSEDKSPKRRHCISREDTQVENVVTDPQEEKPGIVSGYVSGNVNHCSKMIIDTSPIELRGNLRKCNRISIIVDGDTLAAVTRALETPKSARGNSMFSPGEAFWDEAIEVADGLFVKRENFSFERSVAKVQCNKNSNGVKNRVCGEVSQKSLNEGENSVCGVDFNVSMGKHHRNDVNMDREVSPFPVKHFDFSLEDKSLIGSIPFSRYEDNKNESVSSGNISERKCGSMKQEKDSIACSTPNSEKRHSSPNGSNADGTPSSFMLLKDRLDLSHWLPLELCNIYKKKGISKLYSWQVDCLLVDGVLQRRNLVYCASTSAGKSFVAEILMLRRVISTKKMALLVLPYVSICAEKAEHLEVLLEPLGMHVRSYFGNQGGGTLPKDTSVAVCTIEKANSLINRLLEEGRLSEVGIVVIDELHMVGDQSRGYLLELLLTKLRYAAGEGTLESSSGESSGTSSGKNDSAHGLQIVGMSATLPNVASVADWLQAALYQTEFRPVPLEEYIKVGDTIYNKEMHIIRSISKLANLGGKDPDHIVELCNEVVQEGNSVLIFCSSRKGCESTARHIAKFLKKIPGSAHDDTSEFFDITSAIDALRRCPVGLDPVLEEALPCGVAYHHAGLTVEEREIVETCYRKGLIRVLTATSTLAAGVNLPARRVIFRQPRIGRDFIDGTRYRQMSGRAGRTGIDTKGESILLCKPEEIKRIAGILNDSCPPLHSCLSEDKNGMTHAILEVVAGGMVQSAKDIHRYVRCTLLNSTLPFEHVVKSAQDSLKWLCHRKFLEWNEESKLYSSTPLGLASFGSSLNPEDSLIVLEDLSRAREGFVLSSDLHLVYLVTPINGGVEPDWELFYERFMQLSTLDQSVGNRVGVVEPFLMRMAHGAPLRTSNTSKDKNKELQRRSDCRGGMESQNMLSHDQTLRVCKRFYVALILSRLVQEVPVPDVCESFKVARGMVQALQENAGRFASMVSVFCERLGWHDLESLVSKFQNRVSFGVRAEIVELTTIPYVKGSRARALYKAGLRTPQAIAEASVSEITKGLFESSSWAAQEDSAQRRAQLGVAKKIKNGARKIVLEKAEEARVAAFSAFKSLGFDVPQFSQPIILKPASGVFQKEATVSSGGENSSGSVGKPPRSRVLTKSSMEGSINIDNVSSQIRQDESIRVADDGLAALNDPEQSFNKHTAPNSNNVVAESREPDTHHHVKTIGDHMKSGDKPSGFPQLTVNENPCLMGRRNSSEKGPVSAVHTPGGFDSFLNLWESTREFYFDVHFNKLSGMNSIVPSDIHGIAICWENSPVYYVNLPKDLFFHKNRISETSSSSSKSDARPDLVPELQLKIAQQRWDRIGMIMAKKDVRKVAWNLKVQIQVLKQPAVSIQRLGSLNGALKSMDLDVVDSSYYKLSPTYVHSSIDMSIVAWILWPDEEKSSNPNLEKDVKKRLSDEDAAAANRCGRWKNQMRRAAHNGCCRRVAQTRALYSVLWKILVSEALIEALTTIEMPLVNILADMEIRGIGVDMEGCLRARQALGRKLRSLEKEAYSLAGMTFSLYTAADIANVLYVHLKLPLPEGSERAKQHPSTDKHCLDMLRHEHPIVPIIKEHRSLAKLLNCTLGSICSLAKLSMRTGKYTLHGHWLQTSTATGRLSMEEPNLQCVEHMVDFTMSNDTKNGDVQNYKINARDFFLPTEENWILLAADYSQIELRLMAHFSKDSSLIELLSKLDGDVFAMIAAKWTSKAECVVTAQERDQTKRLVYGILYGMGPNSLSEQLNCSLNDAVDKIKSFKKSFPGVSSWLQEAVTTCREKGHVETLKGRKRFLTKIKLGNSKERSKAQRQAVNSICQGSAADIIKIAMINVQSAIVEEVDTSHPSSKFSAEFHMLRGRCRILLQVHDELVMEADPSVIKEAGLLLQMAMEKAVSLLVPLRVKLKVGSTWGSMEPFFPEQQADDFPIPNS